MLGIENLKTGIIGAIKLAESIDEKYSNDGKITLLEALSTGVGSFGDIVKIVKSGSEIKDEFLDLDELEKAELIELVETELDLSNDKVENIVEQSIEFLCQLDLLIKTIRS